MSSKILSVIIINIKYQLNFLILWQVESKELKDNSSLNNISNLEADIMQIIWDKGSISVREVHEIILKEEIEKKEHGYIPYTTIMSIMNSLANKGLLKQDKKSKTYQYSAKIDRQNLSKNIIKSVAEKLLSKSSKSLISSFLSEKDNISINQIIKLLKKIE